LEGTEAEAGLDLRYSVFMPRAFLIDTAPVDAVAIMMALRTSDVRVAAITARSQETLG